MKVTADLHIGDTHLARRGFGGSAGAMAEYVLGIWNRDVEAKEDVYVLGDFIVDIEWVNIVSRMAGQIHLIRGNHEQPRIMSALYAAGVDVMGWVHGLSVDDQRVILCHKWADNGSAVVLHGHGHNAMPGDVGIWTWDKIVDIREAIAWASTSGQRGA